MSRPLRTKGTVLISSTRGNFGNDKKDILQLRWKICEQPRPEYESEMRGMTTGQENDDDRAVSFSFTAPVEETVISLSIRPQLQAGTVCKRFHAPATKPTLNFSVTSLPVKNSRIYTFNATRKRYHKRRKRMLKDRRSSPNATR